MFNIHSVYSDRELVIRTGKKESLEVELRGSGFSAWTSVWLNTGSDGLQAFFQELASHKQPWQGEHTWESLEGDLSLSATCSTLGQVTFLVKLRHGIGESEDWQVEAGLVTELGQLDKIAEEANIFFEQNDA